MQYVRLWLDDRRLGCGCRNFFVLKTGRRWVTLFYAPLLLKTKLPLDVFEAMKATPQPYTRAKMARRIRDTASTLHTDETGKVRVPLAVKEVLAFLKTRSTLK